MSDALVLGSGIVGLWTAHVLSESGHTVEVLAGSQSALSTSAAAACVLVPFLPGDPRSLPFKRSSRWARETLAYMSNLDDAGEFLERMPCYEFGLKGIIEYGFSVVTLDALDFSAFELIDLRRLVAGCDMAVRFECVLCNSTVYLDWLVQRLRTRGVVFRSGTVVDPDDIPWKHHNVVFNCMGYQTVFPDDELYPVLGQSMFVPTEEPVVPAFGIGAGDHAVFAQRRGFHIGAHFIRGVTAGTPRQDLYKSSLDFVTGSYLALCDSVGLSAPAIDLGAVSRVNVGVRPFRPSGPRVERDRAFAALIHNYGHGAHGWTTGYGSALEAVRLAGLL